MKLKILLPFCCIFFFLVTNAQQPLATTPRPFITTWNTAHGAGVSKKNQISFRATGNNFTVSWVNMNNASDTGSQTESAGGDTITFATQGLYKVYVTPGTGTFSAIKFDRIQEDFSIHSDSYKLLSIEQWGDIRWTRFDSAFYYCRNMVLNAADTPNLSNVTNLRCMFKDCPSLTTNAAMNNWNTSHIKDMSRMFEHATAFNQPIGNWDVSNVTSMLGMFSGTASFDQPISNWNVGNVKNMEHMFAYDESAYDFFDVSFNQPINNWNVSSVTDMVSMFYGNTVFNQPLGNWNLSGAPDMRQMLSTGMDCNNYSQTLKGWAGNSKTPNGLSLGVAGLTYDSASAQAAHDNLTIAKGWTIARDIAGHCNIILPVNFIAFNTIQQGNAAVLNWQVADEINAKGYDVEKSANGYNYNTIGFVNADGKRTGYTFTDNNLASGNSYYRIKEVG